MRFFLYRFETSGMRNIAKPLVLNFHDAKIPKNLEVKTTNVKSIYGTNGSGKTSILLSLLLLKSVATNSRYLSFSDDYLSSHLSFLGIPFHAKVYFACYDEEKENEITDFLSYEIVLKSDAGHWSLAEEKICKIIGNSINRSEKPVFEAKEGEICFLPKDLSETVLNDLKDKLHNLLLSSSFVSNSERAESGSELRRIVDLIKSFFGSLSIFVEDQNVPFNPQNILRSTEAMRKAVDAMEQAQKGLSFNFLELPGYDIVSMKDDLPKLRESITHLRDFVHLFKPSLREIEISEKPVGPFVVCNLVFVYEDYSVALSLESKGIRRIVNLFQMLEKVAKGGIGFFDELDASIHEVYLEKLISFFASYSEGQLVFTSQNIAPMRALENSKHAIDFISDQGEHEEWTRHSRYKASRLYPEGMIAGNPFNVHDYTFYRIFLGEGEMK